MADDRPATIPLTDLVGTFGDLIWATHVYSAPQECLLDVFVLADDHELVVQRLLLAGYTRFQLLNDDASVWQSHSGKRVRVVESSTRWARDALGEATRNRDALGAPHLTLPYALAVQHLTAGSSDEEAQSLRDAASPEQLSQAETLITDASAYPDAARLLASMDDEGVD